MRIKEVKKDDQKVNIIFEDDSILEVMDSDYLIMNLYEKEELTQEECDLIKLNTQSKQAKIEALKYISYKIRSSKEVCLRLQSLNYEPEAILIAIENLKSDKYLDDLDYAKRFARTKIRLKKISKKQLEFELSQKGISDEIINSLEELAELDEHNDIKSIILKKYNVSDLKDNKIKLKAMKYLYTKRYDIELIQEVIEELIREA